jgi:hypothetical protein
VWKEAYRSRSSFIVFAVHCFTTSYSGVLKGRYSIRSFKMENEKIGVIGLG